MYIYMHIILLHIYTYITMQVYRYLEVGSCHWSYWDLPCWHAQAVILHKAALEHNSHQDFTVISRLQIYFKH